MDSVMSLTPLSISMASFSLGNRYEIGEELLSINVILGTVLLLPTVLLWSLAMDKIGLYTDYQGVPQRDHLDY